MLPASIVFRAPRLLNLDRPVHLRVDVAREGKRAGDRKRPLHPHVRIVVADIRRGTGLGREVTETLADGGGGGGA